VVAHHSKMSQRHAQGHLHQRGTATKSAAAATPREGMQHMKQLAHFRATLAASVRQKLDARGSKTRTRKKTLADLVSEGRGNRGRAQCTKGGRWPWGPRLRRRLVRRGAASEIFEEEQEKVRGRPPQDSLARAEAQVLRSPPISATTGSFPRRRSPPVPDPAPRHGAARRRRIPGSSPRAKRIMASKLLAKFLPLGSGTAISQQAASTARSQ